MILLTIIMIVLVSSILTPFNYWYRPRPFFHHHHYHFGYRPRMRGSRHFGPMHGPMGRGPRI